MSFDTKKYSRYFKAFSDRSRLKILGLLADKELSVNQITEQVGLSQPTVSRHLAILREAEVVSDRRDGQQVFYSLNRMTVQDCCSGFCNCLEVKVTPAGKPKKSRAKKKK